MKIGILTHQYIDNYGAFLQAYALREAMAKAFPEDQVEIINCINVKHFVINVGGWFRFYKDREGIKEWLRKMHLFVVCQQLRHWEVHPSFAQIKRER